MELRVDSSEVMKMPYIIKTRVVGTSGRLLTLKWEVKMYHYYREANLCTNALTNMSYDHATRYVCVS